MEVVLVVSAFLLAVGQGYEVKGITDYERVRELARINGDLGRLGGLLKLWLTDDVRTAKFGEATILALLGRIEDTQNDNPRTGYTDWNIYYRGKTKSSAKANIKYIQDTINELDACSVNGEIFRLDMVQGWDYLGKDSESYYVFASALRLF